MAHCFPITFLDPKARETFKMNAVMNHFFFFFSSTSQKRYNFLSHHPLAGLAAMFPSLSSGIRDLQIVKFYIPWNFRPVTPFFSANWWLGFWKGPISPEVSQRHFFFFLFMNQCTMESIKMKYLLCSHYNCNLLFPFAVFPWKQNKTVLLKHIPSNNATWLLSHIPWIFYYLP